MEENFYSEAALKKMLLSGQESLINKALNYIYYSDYWRNFFKKEVACPLSFFDQHFKGFIATFKPFFMNANNYAFVKDKNLSFFFKTLWRREVKETVTDNDLLQMFITKGAAGNLALEICSERFYPKIFATLIKKRPNKPFIEDIISKVFLNVYETIIRKGEDFTLKKNSFEAYFIASCKYELFGSGKPPSSLDEIDKLKEMGFQPAFDEFSIKEERIICFKEKVFPKLGERCRAILKLAYKGYANDAMIAALNYNGDAYFRRIKSECMTNAKRLARENCTNY